MCLPFYALSFVQVFFPVSTATKGILFTVFFGLAKTFQYTGVAILGKEGYKRVKGYLKRKMKPLAKQGHAVVQTCSRTPISLLVYVLSSSTLMARSETPNS